MYYKGHYFSDNQIKEMNYILNTPMLRRTFLNGIKNYIIYDIPENLIAKLEYPITYESDYMLSKTRYYEKTIKATDNTTYTEPPRINYFED